MDFLMCAHSDASSPPVPGLIPCQRPCSFKNAILRNTQPSKRKRELDISWAWKAWCCEKWLTCEKRLQLVLSPSTLPFSPGSLLQRAAALRVMRCDSLRWWRIILVFRVAAASPLPWHIRLLSLYHLSRLRLRWAVREPGQPFPR